MATEQIQVLTDGREVTPEDGRPSQIVDDGQTVLAAGGVITRPGPEGQPEVALIHRPKYDDWTLPKGKLEPGESFKEAAVREVEEETGFRCGLDRELGEADYQDAKGRPKVVRYWQMTPLHGGFAPNREVDELVWVGLDEAQTRLSYEFDRDLVGQLDEGGEDGRRNPPRYELYRRKWPIFAVTMVGMFMALIDVTIVNIAIPTLGRDLHAGVSTVSWVLNAYNIMFAVLLVSMGRLADQFGRRRFFVIGLSVFTFGSLLCAISPTIHALIAFRVIQAVGAGTLAPLALAVTAMIFPPKQRGLGLSLLAVVANSAAALGPVIGGLLVEYASWHWIFLINVPIGVVGVLWALRVMPETYDVSASRKVDLIGMAFLGGAVGSLTYALVEANNRGWGSTLIVSLLVASVVLSIGFALSQRYGRFPMLTRGLLRNRQFMGASGAFVLFGMGVIGVLFLAVIAFQTMWHFSSIQAALATLPIPGFGLIVSLAVGRSADRVSPRVTGIAALATMICGLVWLSFLPASPNYWQIVAPLVLIGCGIGGAFPSINVAAMGSVSGQELGLGSGIVNMSRQLGFAIGIAVLVAVFTGTFGNHAREQRTRANRLMLAMDVGSNSRAYTLKHAIVDPNKENFKPFIPMTRTEVGVADIAAQASRDSFSDAFRVAALFVLLAIPLALTMRSNPAQAQAQARERAAAAATSG
jgi:EmrB/QacA subfamily drug resistance transporter